MYYSLNKPAANLNRLFLDIEIKDSPDLKSFQFPCVIFALSVRVFVWGIGANTLLPLLK